MTGETDPWDRFWKYDRLSSFGTGRGSGNYGEPVAAGWRSFFAALPDGARILDLCTGNGALALIAIQANRSFAVTGADLADIRPAAFVSRSKQELKRIRFLGRTPAEALPLPDASFDAVVSQYGIEYSQLDRSLPEAARVLAPGGRLRLACHAAEGAVAAATRRAIAEADFLLDELDLTGRAADCFDAVLALESGRQSGQLALIAMQARYAAFRDGLKAVAERAPGAADPAMLTSVHQTLTGLFEQRHAHGAAALAAQTEELRDEISAHRARQSALLDAARSAEHMDALAATLESLGLLEIMRGEQRDGGALIGWTIEARRPA